MKNISILKKLSLGFGAVVLLTVMLGGYVWNLMQAMDRESTAVEQAYMPVVSKTSKMEALIAGSSLAIKEYFASGQSAQIENGRSLLNEAQQQYNEARALVDNNPRLASLGPLFRELSGKAVSYRQLVDDSARAFAEKVRLRDEMSRVADAASQHIAAFQQVQQEWLEKAVASGIGGEALRQGLERERLMASMSAGISGIRISILRAQTTNAVEAVHGITAQVEELLQQSARLRTLTNGDDIRLARLEEALREYRKVEEAFIRAWSQLDTLAEQRVAMADELVHSVQRIPTLGIELTTRATARLTDGIASGSTSALVLTVTAALLALAVAILLTRGITSALKQCVEFAEAVAAGQLQRRLALSQRDEIGRLGDALRTMVERLNVKIEEAETTSAHALQKEQEAREATRQAEEAMEQAERARREGMLTAAAQLEGVVAIVNTASMELSTQISQSEAGAEGAARRLTESATAMEQMNSTVLEVARSAGIASEMAANTRDRAEKGAQVVGRAVESIRQVQRESLELRQDMTVLGEHAQAINRIMSVISDIADQTNLLALNAAIEAARAGDVGRGFAVVADEVRKLAEKTMASTTDVGNVIRAIQDSTGKSLRQVDTAVQRIEEATLLANESGEALREIVAMVDSAADQVHAIATAAEEQSATSDEINRSLGGINTAASESAEAMGEASRAVTELASQTQVLTRLIVEMQR